MDIKRLPDGTSRGFAFVKFSDTEARKTEGATERESWGGAGEGRRGGDDVGMVWWLGEEDALIQDVVSLKDMYINIYIFRI